MEHHKIVTAVLPLLRKIALRTIMPKNSPVWDKWLSTTASQVGTSSWSSVRSNWRSSTLAKQYRTEGGWRHQDKTRTTRIRYSSGGSSDFLHTQVTIATLQTLFSSTYFVRDQSEIEKLNPNPRKFLELEDILSLKELPIVRFEEQLSLKKLEPSIQYENKIEYIVLVFHGEKKNTTLPDNYKMALQGLENIEKRLKRSPNIAAA